MTVLLKSA